MTVGVEVSDKVYSHANFHIHRATHDNEWVEWEEEE